MHTFLSSGTRMGGVRCPLYNGSDLSRLERSLRRGAPNVQRSVRGDENQVPPLDVPRSQTPAGTYYTADIRPFVVANETTGEDAPVPSKRTAQDTPRAQDVIGLKKLIMSIAACEQANTRSKVVDAATAKSMWFLNEADLLMVEGIHPIKTTEYSLNSIIQRALWKYGHGSLLKMIEARHNWETLLKVDQVALLHRYCLKNKLDQYPAPLKTQVYVELITSLEEMVAENTVDCSRAEKEWAKKRLELHLELISFQPCALRTQTRHMRFVWSNDTVMKLREDQKALEKQIRSLLAICTEIISFLPDTHDRPPPSTRRVLVDATNQKKTLLRHY